MREMSRIYYVDEAPFSAAGDGKTNDRDAVQRALDTAFENGGGTVVLSAGKTYLSGGIILKSNTELHFEDGATLLQSPDKRDYVKPQGNGYEPYEPTVGHNYSSTVKWGHAWYKNYPFVFAAEGSENIAITGSGHIRMDTVTPEESVMRICPIGFYRINGAVISDITISGYHSYAMMPYTSENILIKNVKIGEWSCGNCDGICMMNCRNVRITGCTMNTGDDSVYIFSSYRDPRGGEWWSSDEPQPSENIEIDNNHLVSHKCKAFAFIPWGIDCPDLEKVEISNVYVHDNYIQTMGVWLYNPYTQKNTDPPIKNVRFENNKIDAIEKNFFDTRISGCVGFRSMKEIHNGRFNDGKAFWLEKKNSHADSVGVYRPQNDGEKPFGFISHLNCGDAAIYQGLFVRAEDLCNFTAYVCTDGAKCRMFVRSAETGELIAHRDFDNSDILCLQLVFNVPVSGNYNIGIERGDASTGEARIYYAGVFGGDAAPGYKRVENVDSGEKIIYFYNDFNY